MGSEEMTLSTFIATFEPYFATHVEDGLVIDQLYQPRSTEGMFRCYLVHDVVAGFGHQAIVNLHPKHEPSPRLYFPATMPAAQLLKRQVETEWLPAMQRVLHINRTELPVLW